jgi:hypothetical protein
MRRRALSISFRGKLGGDTLFVAEDIRANVREKSRKETSNVQRSTSNVELQKAEGRPSPTRKSWLSPLFIERWMLDVGRFFFRPAFLLAPPKPRRLLCRRVMRFLLRRAGLALTTGLLIFCCSCERHHVGELPEDQKLEQDGETHATAPHASPSPAVRATPANFFPDKPKP